MKCKRNDDPIANMERIFFIMWIKSKSKDHKRTQSKLDFYIKSQKVAVTS